MLLSTSGTLRSPRLCDTAAVGVSVCVLARLGLSSSSNASMTSPYDARLLPLSGGNSRPLAGRTCNGMQWVNKKCQNLI